MKKLNKRGFTLIELIVVIAILAVLALILVPNVSSYIDKAKRAVAEANARSCYSGAIAEHAVNPAMDATDLSYAVTDLLVSTVDATLECTVELDAVQGVVSSTYNGINGTATFPKK